MSTDSLKSYLTNNESTERMKTVLKYLEANEDDNLKEKCFQFGKFIFSKSSTNKDTIDEWKKKMLAHFTAGKPVKLVDANMSGVVWKFKAAIQIIGGNSITRDTPFDMTVAQLADVLELESGFAEKYAFDATLAKNLVWKVPLIFTKK